MLNISRPTPYHDAQMLVTNKTFCIYMYMHFRNTVDLLDIVSSVSVSRQYKWHNIIFLIDRIWNNHLIPLKSHHRYSITFSSLYFYENVVLISSTMNVTFSKIWSVKITYLHKTLLQLSHDHLERGLWSLLWITS